MESIISIEIMAKQVIKMIQGHQYDFVIGNHDDIKNSPGCSLYFDPIFQDNTDNGYHNLSSLIECGMLKNNEKIVCKKQIYSNINSNRDYVYITNFCNLFIPAFILPDNFTFGLIHCDNIRDCIGECINHEIYKLLIVNELYSSLTINENNNIPCLLSVITSYNRDPSDIIKTVDMIKRIGIILNTIFI